ncbi:MAG TPA: GNAT family protein [bacterium]
MIGSPLKTQRLLLRPLDPDDARVLLDYVVANRSWLAPWEPAHPASYFTVEGQRNILYQCLEDRRNETGVLFGIFERGNGVPALCGRISVSGIVRGIWQNGFVGYSIAESRAGQGYMTEALRRIVLFGFGELALHRLQASIIPRNTASLRVAQKSGFRYEGRALRYLRIDETWEDHDLYALTADEVRAGFGA